MPSAPRTLADLTALELLGALVLDDGRPWAEAATPGQWQDATAIIDGARPRRHFILRGRGMSKTTDAAAVALALLVTEAPRQSRSFAYAADADQAGHLMESVAGFVERSGLAPAVELTARRLTVKHSGAALTVEASDGASAFGTRPWLTIVDELGSWPETPNHRRLWSAIVSAIPKVRQGRLVVISTAGAPGSLASTVWNEAERSRSWRAARTPGPPPWWSPEDVEQVKADLTASEYRRLILCEFASGDDALTTPEDVAACVRPEGGTVVPPRRSRRYVMTLDLGLKNDATALVVAHSEARERGRVTVIDRVLRWKGTRTEPVSLADVEAAVLAVHKGYGRPSLVVDPWQSAQLSERLRSAGVHVREFTFTPATTDRLARGLYTAIRDRTLDLPDDPALTDELANVRLVEKGPGRVRLDHRAGRHDDQAVAVAMAVDALTETGPVGHRVHHHRPDPNRPMHPVAARKIKRADVLAPTAAESAVAHGVPDVGALARQILGRPVEVNAPKSTRKRFRSSKPNG